MARLARRGRESKLAIIAAVTALACFLAFAPGAGAQAPARIDETEAGAPYVPGELLVAYKEDAPTGAASELAREIGGEVEERLPLVDAELVEFPQIKARPSEAVRERLLARKKERLERDPAVAAVDYNYVRSFSFVPNDPRFREQWHLRKVGAPSAWNRARGKGVRVAVIDSGIAPGHPDLRSKISAQRDFVDGDGTADDEVGHGTHVAGVIAAATDNGRGVAGSCPSCRIIVAKIADQSSFDDKNVIKGINWAVSRGAEVMNLSFSGPEESAVLERAINRAWRSGVVVVAAAGNAGDARAQYPAAYRNVISVSATNRQDRRASFSSYGPTIDVAAPGTGILSTQPPRAYGAQSGTSLAAPQVAALAGLLAEQGREAPAIRRRIQATARDLGPRGRDRFYGHGRVDFAAATRGSGNTQTGGTGASQNAGVRSVKVPGSVKVPVIGAKGWPFGFLPDRFPFTSVKDRAP